MVRLSTTQRVISGVAAAVVLAISGLALAQGAGDGRGRKLKIRNPTGDAIVTVYVVPAGVHAMAADALDGKGVKPGRSATVDLSGGSGCLYDITAIGASGEAYQIEGYDVCAAGEFRIGDRGVPICPGDPRCRRKRGRP